MLFLKGIGLRFNTPYGRLAEGKWLYNAPPNVACPYDCPSHPPSLHHSQPERMWRLMLLYAHITYIFYYTLGVIREYKKPTV